MSGALRTRRPLAAKAVSGDADGTALIAGEDQIPTWRQRDYSSVPVGTPIQVAGAGLQAVAAA